MFCFWFLCLSLYSGLRRCCCCTFNWQLSSPVLSLPLIQLSVSILHCSFLLYKYSCNVSPFWADRILIAVLMAFMYQFWVGFDWLVSLFIMVFVFLLLCMPGSPQVFSKILTSKCVWRSCLKTSQRKTEKVAHSHSSRTCLFPARQTATVPGVVRRYPRKSCLGLAD